MSAKPNQPDDKKRSQKPAIDPTHNYPIIRSDVTLQQTSFSGPLPPPAILKQYNEAVAGAADRILAMAEREGEHRRAIELLALEHNAKILRHTARDILIGQVFAFIISLGFLTIAAYAIDLGNPLAGTILSTIGIGGIVSAFIFGRSGPTKSDKQP